jgi:hypothetical protein
MPYVEEVFDQTWSFCLESVRTTEKHSVARVLRKWELGDISRWLGDADPNEPVALASMKDVGPRAERRSPVRLRGDVNALAVAVVDPGMVGADHAAIAHFAEGEFGSAMDAEVLPGMDLFAIAPKDDITAEKPSCDRLSKRYIATLRDCEPLGSQHIVSQDGVRAGIARKRERISQFDKLLVSPFIHLRIGSSSIRKFNRTVLKSGCLPQLDR